MARVYTLYRVSTVGQVDHDDIPMQRIACREFAQAQAGWEIVKELYEKGVSGYKVKTENRDAIMEIKADAGREIRYSAGIHVRPPWPPR